MDRLSPLAATFLEAEDVDQGIEGKVQALGEVGRQREFLDEVRSHRSR